MSLRDRIVAVLAQAQAAGSLVISIEAVLKAIAEDDAARRRERAEVASCDR